MMNERIKELESQCWEPRQYGPAWFNSTKFAEMIVRECCDWIDGSPSTDAGQLLLTKSFIIANIKGYFGVEE